MILWLLTLVTKLRSQSIFQVSGETKLVAPDRVEGANFGYSVALSGPTIVVGAVSDDDKGTKSGSAYVFGWNGTAWSQTSKLVASDGEEGDFFGWDVAVSGKTIVVGSPYDDDKGDGSGSAYVFGWNGTSWSQNAKLLASDGAEFDCFGWNVAVSDQIIVVGSVFDDDKDEGSGSVYVFGWNGTAWSQTSKLVASDGARSDWFGYSVALSGQTIVVGAYLNDNKGSDNGSVYVFSWNETAWSQNATLVASDGSPSDYFGRSVAISGETIVVGAAYDDVKGTGSGSAYVFGWNGTAWFQSAKLFASDGEASDWFGVSVAVSGQTIVVGAYLAGGKVSSSGSAYVFGWNGTAWSQSAKHVAFDGASNDSFGWSVAVSGETIVVGAYFDDNMDYDSGSVYVFGDPSPTISPTASPTNPPPSKSSEACPTKGPTSKSAKKIK